MDIEEFNAHPPAWLPRLRRLPRGIAIDNPTDYPQNAGRTWGPPENPHMRVSERTGPRLGLKCLNCGQEKTNIQFHTVDLCFACVKAHLLRPDVDVFGVARFWIRETEPDPDCSMWDEELLYRQYGWEATRGGNFVTELSCFHLLSTYIARATDIGLHVTLKWNKRIQAVEYEYSGRRFRYAEDELLEAIEAGLLPKDYAEGNRDFERIVLW